MSSALGPRVVLITRETDYEALLGAPRDARAGALLPAQPPPDPSTRPRPATSPMQAAVTELRAGIPREWRIAQVRRADLDRFLFAPEDVVVAVGQDGLVANVAKYLSGQPVIGVNPEPARNPGILVPHDVASAIRLLGPAAAGQVATEDRTMLRAVLDTGQALLALNEVFIGHASHQSARYVIAHGGREEAQSSSGLIVASGTGATGWALSIGQATGYPVDLAPGDRGAVFLVREPWPSQATGVSVTHGRLGALDALQIVSRMNENGVVFADGMEQDRLPFGWGAALSVQVAEQRLCLVPSERVRSTVVRPPSPPTLARGSAVTAAGAKAAPRRAREASGFVRPLAVAGRPLAVAGHGDDWRGRRGCGHAAGPGRGGFRVVAAGGVLAGRARYLGLVGAAADLCLAPVAPPFADGAAVRHRCHRACRRLGCGRERMADSAVHRRRLRALRGAGPPSRRGVRASRRLPMTPSGRRQQRAGHVHQSVIVGWASAHHVSHGCGGLKPTLRP